jgi:hypothetical protein
MRTLRVWWAGALLIFGGACGDIAVPDYNASSFQELSTNPS